MESDGDLMKMLMQADAPNEDIQGPLGDTAIVQQGVRAGEKFVAQFTPCLKFGACAAV